MSTFDVWDISPELMEKSTAGGLARTVQEESTDDFVESSSQMMEKSIAVMNNIEDIKTEYKLVFGEQKKMGEF